MGMLQPRQPRNAATQQCTECSRPRRCAVEQSQRAVDGLRGRGQADSALHRCYRVLCLLSTTLVRCRHSSPRPHSLPQTSPTGCWVLLSAMRGLAEQLSCCRANNVVVLSYMTCIDAPQYLPDSTAAPNPLCLPLRFFILFLALPCPALSRLPESPVTCWSWPSASLLPALVSLIHPTPFF